MLPLLERAQGVLPLLLMVFQFLHLKNMLRVDISRFQLSDIDLTHVQILLDLINHLEAQVEMQLILEALIHIE